MRPITDAQCLAAFDEILKERIVVTGTPCGYILQDLSKPYGQQNIISAPATDDGLDKVRLHYHIEKMRTVLEAALLTN